MREEIQQFKAHVKEASANPKFVHHKWFVKWHLEIVERIALELCEHYPDADRDLVEVMVWLHDYGKILDFDHEYETTQIEGPKILAKLGLPMEFTQVAVNYIDTLDKKLEIDLHKAPLEVQIVASADGCSHLVGPFMHLWWYEHPDQTFEELMAGNRRKADKDWSRKITLPEARTAFEARRNVLLEQCGELPTHFLS
jgi:hypothetical protein